MLGQKLKSGLYIQLRPYHGGLFEGNECRKLLNCVKVLQQLAETNSDPNIYVMIEAFKGFNLVVKACLGHPSAGFFRGKSEKKLCRVRVKIAELPKRSEYHLFTTARRTQFIRD